MELSKENNSNENEPFIKRDVNHKHKFTSCSHEKETNIFPISLSRLINLTMILFIAYMLLVIFSYIITHAYDKKEYTFVQPIEEIKIFHPNLVILFSLFIITILYRISVNISSYDFFIIGFIIQLSLNIITMNDLKYFNLRVEDLKFFSLFISLMNIIYSVYFIFLFSLTISQRIQYINQNYTKEQIKEEVLLNSDEMKIYFNSLIVRFGLNKILKNIMYKKKDYHFTKSDNHKQSPSKNIEGSGSGSKTGAGSICKSNNFFSQEFSLDN